MHKRACCSGNQEAAWSIPSISSTKGHGGLLAGVGVKASGSSELMKKRTHQGSSGLIFFSLSLFLKEEIVTFPLNLAARSPGTTPAAYEGTTMLPPAQIGLGSAPGEEVREARGPHPSPHPTRTPGPQMSQETGKVATGRAPSLPAASLVHTSHCQTVPLTSEVLGFSCPSFAFPSLGHSRGHKVQRKELREISCSVNSSHSLAGERIAAETSLGRVSISSPFYS